MIQLKNFTGLPMYFLCQAKKEGKFRITFSNNEKSKNEDIILIGKNENKILII